MTSKKTVTKKTVKTTKKPVARAAKNAKPVTKKPVRKAAAK